MSEQHVKSQFHARLALFLSLRVCSKRELKLDRTSRDVANCCTLTTVYSGSCSLEAIAPQIPSRNATRLRHGRSKEPAMNTAPPDSKFN